MSKWKSNNCKRKTWMVDRMVRERVPLFNALIRNFPALLRLAQSSRKVRGNQIRPHCCPLLTYTEGYTKCSGSLSRWLVNSSVTLLLYLSVFFKFMVIGLVMEAVGLKWVCCSMAAIAWVTKHNWQKNIAIRTEDDMCICILFDIE